MKSHGNIYQPVSTEVAQILIVTLCLPSTIDDFIKQALHPPPVKPIANKRCGWINKERGEKRVHYSLHSLSILSGRRHSIKHQIFWSRKTGQLDPGCSKFSIYVSASLLLKSKNGINFAGNAAGLERSLCFLSYF